MNYIQKHFAKITSNLNTSTNSNSLVLKTSYISNASDDPIECYRVYYNINNTEKNVIVCLKIYESELIQSYFITPQVIFLLYDLSSKQSFDHLMEYYNSLKNDKKYKNVKFVLIGNKNDLIHEDHKNEEENEEDKEEKEEKEEVKEEIKDEKKEEVKHENEEKKKEEVKKDENKIENKEENEDSKNIKSDGIIKKNKEYFHKVSSNEKFGIVKEISGLSGYGLAELFKDVIRELYIDIKSIETSVKEVNTIDETDSFEREIDIDKRKSYYDKAYKKEIHKINRIKHKPKVCFCVNCGIF